MHILEELELADIQLRKQGLLRILGLFALTALIILAELGLYFYIFTLIPETTSLNSTEMLSYKAYYEEVSLDNYTIYAHTGGRLKKILNCSTEYVNSIKTVYNAANRADYFYARRPNPMDLGIINYYHYLAYWIIYGLAIGFMLEPYFRRTQNRHDVLIFCEVYNTYSNPENFESKYIELIEKYQYYKKVKYPTYEEKFFTKFIADKLINPRKAERKEKQILLAIAKKKKHDEYVAMQKNEKRQHERQKYERAQTLKNITEERRLLNEQKALEKAEANARVLEEKRQIIVEAKQERLNEKAKEKAKRELIRKREIERKNRIKQDYIAEVKRINDIMQITIPTETELKIDWNKLSKEEKYELKRSVADEKKKALEKRKLIKLMRKESSFLR